MHIQKSLARQDCTIAYDAWPGQHHVTVVLIHGYGVHRKMWVSQVKALQEADYPVINIDVRGHGDSRPIRHFSVRAAAQDLKAIIEAEQCRKTVIVGLSMGGYITQEYLARFGGSLGYLIVGATPMFMQYRGWEKSALGHSGPIMRYLFTWGCLKKAAAKASTCTTAAYEAALDMFGEMNKEEFLVSWQDFTKCLYERRVQPDAPLLVVSGEKDLLGTIKKHLDDWPLQYPGCKIKTIPAAGHLANMDKPDLFNEIMLEFVRECESC